MIPTTTELRVVKRAWIRDRTVPPGRPAKGKINCPCGQTPESDYSPDQADIHCPCGQVYRWDGWLKNVITVDYLADWNRGTAYHLRFPLSELANCIALCGWTILNGIRRTPEIQAEIDRLSALPYLDIPDGPEWYAKHGTKYNIHDRAA